MITVLLIIVLIVLTCICADLEKRKRDKLRYADHSPFDSFDSAVYGLSYPQMSEANNPDPGYASSIEVIERMPSARF